MRRRRDQGGQTDGLPMTPMIDVVFLLLIFFILTVKSHDVFAHLDAFTPQGKPGPTVPLLRIEIAADGFALNSRALPEADVRDHLKRLGAADPNQTVLLISSPTAPHGRLVQALDMCSEAGLHNLSVLTAGGAQGN